MNIQTLLLGVQETEISINISGLALNTGSLKEGDAFIALQGENSHGSDYVEQAIEQGCVVILTEGRDLECAVPCIRIDNLRSHLATLAQRFYRQAHSIKLIGVTGTNGKTSVSLFIARLLEGLKVKTGVIGTLGISGSDEKTANTTPDILALYRALDRYHQEGVEVAVIEVSSHALMQNRVDGLTFDQAIFTNLTQDHLDYHKTMKDYRQAKGRLFSDDKSRHVIVNQDDENHAYFLDLAADKKQSTFSVDDLSYCHINNQGFLCRLDQFVFEIPLLGRFNLSNTLAALASLRALGYSDDDVIPQLSRITSPPGRMQKIANHNIWIDYAHTPDALENAMKTLREHYPESKLRVLFGCGGNRDVGKRAKMGGIASELANSVILTNDNPRNEDAQSIIDDIQIGMKEGFEAEVILDRELAIQTAITTLTEDECLLIAGKGHETTQTTGAQILPFSDIKVAQNALL
ncbi:MAG: UDP-N-acetylmuramoyl-L-alanyl-D-glutamate--2,6-diaminopimelate ligase [Gammaproteobacteria bacterium]|nr:UDP-N-acetylmuramoyl-L-alanyl-D-glutamate--2,6-diaminopimelate ligase [Gammaproteobacteria bacterium]